MCDKQPFLRQMETPKIPTRGETRSLCELWSDWGIWTQIVLYKRLIRSLFGSLQLKKLNHTTFRLKKINKEQNDERRTEDENCTSAIGEHHIPQQIKRAKLGCLLLVQLGVVLEEQKDQSTLSEDFWLSKACADVAHLEQGCSYMFKQSAWNQRYFSVYSSVQGIFLHGQGDWGVSPCAPTSCHKNIYPFQIGLVVL